MEIRSALRLRAAGESVDSLAHRRRPVERAVALAHRAAVRPYRSAVVLLGANLVAVGLFVGLGQLLFADPAELFRELMPGTWLSFAQIAFIAVVALAIHRELVPGARLRLDNFWGISVLVFAVFAIDEATQLTIFLADALTAVGAVAPGGFRDLDAFLLTVLLVAGGAALLRYGSTLLSHPAALALMALGVALGAGSQLFDSTLASTSSEFVAEESLKLIAEPFLIGAYLLVLHRVMRRDAPGARPPTGV